ncbi:MAG TPA: hypothetical protein VFM36_07985 [Thermoanaerobaculia bacterium]|nr:hypothetical protein [Thermoanaerobaculia bacterium]
MLLSVDELAMLTAACSDRTNQKAVELVNLMGTQSGPEIARQVMSLPKAIKTEIEKHVREAIDEQKRRSRAR